VGGIQLFVEGGKSGRVFDTGHKVNSGAQSHDDLLLQNVIQNSDLATIIKCSSKNYVERLGPSG
jgi:hypothetical protein